MGLNIHFRVEAIAENLKNNRLLRGHTAHKGFPLLILAVKLGRLRLFGTHYLLVTRLLLAALAPSL